MIAKNAWVALAASMLLSGAACAADSTLKPTPDCRPSYPARALEAQVQGVTKMRFHVDITGKVTQVDILQSAGKTHEHKMLDNAAATALARCPLTPLKDADGNPTAGEFDVTYTWRLE